MNFNQIGLGKYIDIERWGISSFGLKVIAMVTMLIDHMAVVFAANNIVLYHVMRGIGRLSFPLFCFLLVEGFFYTRNRTKHCINLVLFALISEVPYDMFAGSIFDMKKQNVIFTLLIGFIMIWVLDSILYETNKNTGKKVRREGFFDTVIGLIVVFVCLVIAYVFNPTYSFAGIILILLFYVTHGKHIGTIVSNIIFNMGLYTFGTQWLGTFSAIIIEFYNGKPGNKKWKYFFYVFYPLHLLILAIIKSKYLH